jgi:hypothetical protein
MFHTVYDSYEESPNGRDYIGKHSTDDPYDNYKGSFYDESFNPDNKIVFAYAKTEEGAVWFEIMFQKVFGVVEDPQFANKSYQTSTKFLFTPENKGEDHPNFDKIIYHNPETGKERRFSSPPGDDWKLGRSPQFVEKCKKRTHSLGTKNKMSKSGGNREYRPHSNEIKEKISSSLAGRKWWVNAKNKTKFQIECPGPDWQSGRDWSLG